MKFDEAPYFKCGILYIAQTLSPFSIHWFFLRRNRLALEQALENSGNTFTSVGHYCAGRSMHGWNAMQVPEE